MWSCFSIICTAERTLFVPFKYVYDGTVLAEKEKEDTVVAIERRCPVYDQTQKKCCELPVGGAPSVAICPGYIDCVPVRIRVCRARTLG